MKQALIHCTIILLYVLLACLMLPPLPAHLSDGLLAAESGDSLLQSWVLQWNLHKLSTSLIGYFDANIFYPYTNTFAYHDHLFGLGLLGFPIYFISHNPLVTYNSLLFLSFVFSAYAMFLLCREITQDSYAAWIGGVIFGFLPFRFAHLDHLNLLSVYWLPLCFLSLTRYLSLQPKRPSNDLLMLPLFWLCYFLQALTSFNYLFLSAIALSTYGIILALWQLYRKKFPWSGHVKRNLLVFLVGAGLVGLGLLPLALPYLEVNKSMGFERTVEETEGLSARLQDYAVAPENNVLYGQITKRWQSPLSPYPREQVLFPGILTTLLAGIGLLYGLNRHRKPQCDGERVGFGVLAFVAFILSLGPFAQIFGKRIPLPYSWLYHVLPGFKSMRVPARFGLLLALSLAVLASIGVMELFRQWERKKVRPKLLRFLIILLLGVIVLFESHSSFSTLTRYPGNAESLSEVYRWLRSQPAPLRIVELPVRSPRDNFEAMYYSTFHWHNMLNGRSAFIPTGIERAFAELRDFPSQRSITLLKSLAIEYVVVHTQNLEDALPEILPHGLTLLRRFGDDWLFIVEQADETVAHSGKTINPVAMHVASPLQQSERYTMGVELESSALTAFSPLPEEFSVVQLEWERDGKPFSTESSRLALPVLLEKEERYIGSLHFNTPDEPGDYLLRLTFQSSALSPKDLSTSIALLSSRVDSRTPHILQVEFLWNDVPGEWSHGKPLPIQMLVKNSGDTLWKAAIENRALPRGEVRLAVVDWYDTSSGDALIKEKGMKLGARGLLRYDLPPGEEISIEMEIPTPDSVGEFLLELDMVSEHVGWFSPDRSQTFKKKIHLK